MSDKPPVANLLVTCLLDSLFPNVAQAVVEVLEKQGIAVRVPAGQTCCGQPAFNAGFWNEARIMARHTLDVFEDTSGPVVIPSGSCAAMIARHYPHLFEDYARDKARAQALSARVVEFTQYLVDDLGLADLGAAYKGTAVYHPSCHTLRDLGIERQPRILLAHVRGLRLVEQQSPATCCGFGGLFAIKMDAISGAMLNERLDAFRATGAELVIGCDISCLMHIEGGLRRQGCPMRTAHIAQVLADGLEGLG